METTTRFPDFDGRIRKLLAEWSPTIGPPTCRKGCSNCCHFAVSASSAEAAYLLGYIQSRSENERDRLLGIIEGHVDKLARHFAAIGQTTSPLLEIWKLGGCPFLLDQACSIYPVRPYPCRAAHVWHDSKYCGSSVGPSRMPAELVEIRDITFWETMRREVDAGRRPFWGQLTVVAYFLFLNADLYYSGGDLRQVVDLPWQETRLVQFTPEGSLAETAEWIDKILDRLREESAEPERLGLRRASTARSKEDLDCDPDDKARIEREIESLHIIQ